MNKTELISRIARKLPRLTKKDTALAVDLILDLIQLNVIKANRIEIRRFGTFTLRCRARRSRLNLKTGEKIAYPASYAMHFKPAKELRARADVTRLKSAYKCANTNLKASASLPPPIGVIDRAQDEVSVLTHLTPHVKTEVKHASSPTA